MSAQQADHGGGIDAAVRQWGGARADWMDLSTGINPVPYPVGMMADAVWTALPDIGAVMALECAARRFWAVPEGAAVLAAPGASAVIAQIPALMAAGRVVIPGPTYNEHGRAFAAAGWQLSGTGDGDAVVVVRPNNPDGMVRDVPVAALRVIDESFGDVMPETSVMAQAGTPGTLILKSFGKFWGLAGLRLGFVIGDAALVAKLAARLGPWPVSGPALAIGTAALSDFGWAEAARQRLLRDARRLDAMMAAAGADIHGGTSLFRLYRVKDAMVWQDRLAQHRILTRTFPYSAEWLRLGLPGPDADWARLKLALGLQ